MSLRVVLLLSLAGVASILSACGCPKCMRRAQEQQAYEARRQAIEAQQIQGAGVEEFAP